MACDINACGSLRPLIDPYLSCPDDTIPEHHRRSACTVKVPQKSYQHCRVCRNWVFSASNVHLVEGLTGFKAYTTYESHGLTLTDQCRVLVLGIGTVVLTIGRQQESGNGHYITFEDVLHVASWMCNVFSSNTSSKLPQSLSVPGRTLVLLS
jgi:hypothetical protein